MSNNLEPDYKMAAALDEKQRAEKIQKEALEYQPEAPFEVSSWDRLQTVIKKRIPLKFKKSVSKNLLSQPL